MLGNIGLPTLLFIILIALLLFGPNKLPELGRAMGKTLREFKNGAKDIMGDDDAKSDSRQQVDTSDVVRSEQRKESKDDRRLPE